jgi:RNA processing factor Prp31
LRKALDIRKLALARIRKQLSQEKSKRDLIIGKVVDTIDTLNKTINSLYIRLATWYSLYFPELWQNEKDLEKFC